MTRKTIYAAAFSLFAAIAWSQSADPVVLSYQRNFVRASMSTKIDLLGDAARITTINMTPLYVDALTFADAYAPLLGDDSQLAELAAQAAGKLAAYKDPAALPALRAVFARFTDQRVRVACLSAFAVLAKGRADDIAFLNAWFAEGASPAAKGQAADPKVLAAAAAALGSIGDPSSYPVLFQAATGSGDTVFVEAAAAALNKINDNYVESALAVIGRNKVKDAYAAFSFAQKKDSLGDAGKGRIAEAAFLSALAASSTAQADDPVLPRLFSESMEQLTALKWSKASPAVVKHFYQTQIDYKAGKANVGAMIPVIKCLGAMGTTEAAQALSIFLGLLNSDTEQKKTYNEQLMLAVIQSLGDLGDKTAFDYLLYVGYLDYPETVKQASRDALARLKW